MEINDPLGDIYMKMWMIMRHYVYFWNKFHKFRFCFYTFFNSADLKIDSLGISFPLLTIIFFFFFFTYAYVGQRLSSWKIAFLACVIQFL